jgi:hypothetical protein
MLAGKLDPAAPNDVLVAIPPSSYMEYSPVAKLYTSRIYLTELQGGVLGGMTSCLIGSIAESAFTEIFQPNLFGLLECMRLIVYSNASNLGALDGWNVS